VGLILVLGGTRSGKSAHAEKLAAATGLPVRYVGTADPQDASMATRIATHQDRRPAGWETVSATDDLAVTVSAGQLTLIDGLGGWIAGRPTATVRRAITELIEASHSAEVIVVAEQAGDGLLPLERIARDWLDLLGESIQELSSAATQAHLVVAGRVIELPPA
jgi:nicotinate-nucleotide--dimethylbenzimidazole phosphoribosyltransferase